MRATVEKIQQAMSSGVVLFDNHGELCQLNTVAVEILLHENSNPPIISKLTETVRMMSLSDLAKDSIKNMRFDSCDAAIVCTVRKVHGDRFRVILKHADETTVQQSVETCR